MRQITWDAPLADMLGIFVSRTNRSSAFPQRGLAAIALLPPTVVGIRLTLRLSAALALPCTLRAIRAGGQRRW